MQRLSWLVVLVVACGKPADQPPAGHVAEAAGDPSTGSDGRPHRRKHADRREPVIADAPPVKLDVTAHGATTTWQKNAFDKVARYTKGTDGEAREVWSLRELAHQLAGPTARVVSVTGADGTKTIAPAAWVDATRTPLLHTTRRGTLKFRWADAAGTWAEAEVKDVTRIELAP